MNISIERLVSILKAHPKTREWFWFIVLWCGGLFAALALAYPIKLAIKAAS
jgi:hypothetical protein